MRHGVLSHARALTLLVAFGIGLVGQAVVAFAMPMQMLQHTMVQGSSADHSGDCRGCIQQQDAPAMPAKGANCIFAFCSVPLAVLPSGPIVAPAVRESVLPIVLGDDVGITIRPDLGPPRSTPA